MRRIHCLTAVLALLCGSDALPAQQPEIVHAQLTTRSLEHGLGAELESLKRTNGSVWAGYAFPVVERFHSGWDSDRTAYLEGDHASSGSTTRTEGAGQDHALVLFRIEGGTIGKLRVEAADRTIDAGGLRFVWLSNVTPAESIGELKALAMDEGSKRLRDSAIHAISMHRSAEALPTLVALTAATNDLELREKAAFWLANQRGAEGFAAIQRLARDDADPRFREKITFDLTLSKEPAALNELIRMAHSDAAPRVRKQAQFWMATKGGKQVAGDLRQATESDPDQQVRKQAVFALSRLPGDEAATQLIQVAGTSKDPEVRKQAIFWLGQSEDPRALAYLTKLLKSDDRP